MEMDQRKNYVRNVAKKFGRAKLASHFNVTLQNVHKWCVRNQFPASRVVEIEALTGIPCWELRPDIFPPERFSDRT